MKRLIFLFLAVPLLLTLYSSKVKAAVVEKQYDRVYEAQSDFVQVTESKTISITQPSWYIPAGTEESFIIFNPIEKDPNALEKIQKTLSSIKVSDSYGLNLNYSSETTAGGNLQIKVRFPSNINHGSNYKITLTYNSYGLLIKSGSIRDMYIPAFSSDYIFEGNNSKETISTQAKIPVSFGEINFSAPETKIDKSDNFWVMNFTQDQLVGQTGWIQIGKTQYYSFNIVQPYSPSTSIPFPYNTYTIVIPRDIKSGNINQEVYFTTITPEPTAIYKDIEGNLIAEFRVPANASGNITVSGYAVLNENIEIDPAKSGVLSDISKQDFVYELASAKYWESDAEEIIQTAKMIQGSETNVYKLMQKTYEYIVNKIDYDTVKKFGTNERQGALLTLRNGAGVCMEYSDLFIALMRAMGIPARGAFGNGYSAIDYLSTQDNSMNHQWAEVFIPGIDAWIPVDTTWGENGPAVIGGDLNHFYTHVAAVDPNTPSTTEATFYGFLEISDRKDFIDPVDKTYIQNQNGKSEDDLLQMYPQKLPLNNSLSNLTQSVKLFFGTINADLNFTLNRLSVKDEKIRWAIIILIYFIIICIIIALFVVLLRLRRKKVRINTNRM